MKWSMWIGLFEATIHNQPISDQEKMTHLQTLTTGKANHAIFGYSCNNTMCNAVLHELRQRYGRPDIIINDFVNRLQSFQQQSIQRRDSYMEFSTFISNIAPRLRHATGSRTSTNQPSQKTSQMCSAKARFHVHSTDKLTTQLTAASIRIYIWKRRIDSFWKRNFVTTEFSNIKWKTAHQSTYAATEISMITQVYTTKKLRF